MGTGLPFVDVGLGVAATLGVIWWMIALTTKSFAERRREARARTTIPRQPWADDKAGGRANH